MHTETTLESKTIFEGKIITVTLDKALLEDGTTAPREVVRHHGGAGVLAMTDEDEVYMVRQFRYPFGEELWELPAGKLEAGEDPLQAAQRELAEECGLCADEYLDLQPLYPTVGYCSEVIYTWLARGLHPADAHPDEDEFLTVEKVPFTQALEMVLDGRIRDSKTVAGILKVQALRAAGRL